MALTVIEELDASPHQENPPDGSENPALEALRADLDKARAELRTLRGSRDAAAEELRARVAELEAELDATRSGDGAPRGSGAGGEPPPEPAGS